jgi:sulfatase modifying factor 1
MGWHRSVIAILVASPLLCICAFAMPAVAQDHHAPKAFKDCPECPEMVPIPAGSFVMGVPPGENERENVPLEYRDWSTPQHQVSIREGFAIGRYDVTWAEFADFVKETNYSAGNACWLTLPNPAAGRLERRLIIGRTWEHPGFRQTERHPVVCVSWGDAKAYVSWLSTKTKRPYRLPTEAEWEYPARAGSSTARFWGDGRAEACRYANVLGITKQRDAKFAPTGNYAPLWDLFFPCLDLFAESAPVGSFAPNGLGLYDMLGNIDQWVEDCWAKGYEGAPNDGSARLTGDCNGRMVRGGSWKNPPDAVRSGHRSWLGIGMRTSSVGFRVAAPVDALVSSLPAHRDQSPLHPLVAASP